MTMRLKGPKTASTPIQSQTASGTEKAVDWPPTSVSKLPAKMKNDFEALAEKAFRSQDTLLEITLRNDLQSSKQFASGKEYLPRMTYLLSYEEESVCNSEIQLYDSDLDVALDRLSQEVAEALHPGAEVTLRHNEVMGHLHTTEIVLGKSYTDGETVKTVMGIGSKGLVVKGPSGAVEHTSGEAFAKWAKAVVDLPAT